MDLSLGLTLGARSVFAHVLLSTEIAAGAGNTTVNMSPFLPAGKYLVPGVYPDLNPASGVTLTIVSTDGSGTVVTRGADDYRLGGTARFRAETVLIAVPAQMVAPALVGGAELATLTLAVAPMDGGSPILSYDYQVTLAADTAFAAPVAQGTVAAAARATPVLISPLAAGSYIARNRAVNAVGPSLYSPASSPATATAVVSGDDFNATDFSADFARAA